MSETDIVEQISTHIRVADDLGLINGGDIEISKAALRAALAEILRLRSDLSRMREALEVISKRAASDVMRDIARAALSPATEIKHE